MSTPRERDGGGGVHGKAGRQVSSGYVTWPISSWQYRNPSIGTGIRSCQIEDWTNVRLGHRCFHAADVCHFVAVSTFRRQEGGNETLPLRCRSSPCPSSWLFDQALQIKAFFLSAVLEGHNLKEICQYGWCVLPLLWKLQPGDQWGIIGRES